MAATHVCSSPYPFHCPSWTRSLRVTHELRGRQPQWLCSEFVPFLLLFDCQEAFHCCLVVTCINRINMISIQCHRVGEWWSGKPEFENVSDPAGVYIPFKKDTEGIYGWYYRTESKLPGGVRFCVCVWGGGSGRLGGGEIIICIKSGTLLGNIFGSRPPPPRKNRPPGSPENVKNTPHPTPCYLRMS